MTKYRKLRGCLDGFFFYHSSLITHHFKIPHPFGTITYLPSLNIFHTVCGLHTYHSVQLFFFPIPRNPNLVKEERGGKKKPKSPEPSERRKEKEKKKPRSPNPVKEEEKKKKKNPRNLNPVKEEGKNRRRKNTWDRTQEKKGKEKEKGRLVKMCSWGLTSGSPMCV